MEKPASNDTSIVYQLRNLHSRAASILLKEKLTDIGFEVINVEPGRLVLGGKTDFKNLTTVLKKYGIEIIKDKDRQLVEQIKLAIIELIHYMNNMNSVVRKSEYLVEKLGKSYSYLSRLFSAYESITLEKYIILQKIERIKDLIDENELTLSEIAFIMDYSSVQYLSNQFKKITGFSVSEYKSNTNGKKKYLDDLTL